VIEQCAALESKSNIELRSLYEQRGFPAEEGLTRQNILDLLCKVVVWEALPLVELRSECALVDNLSSKDNPRIISANAQRRELVEFLLLDKCADVYESRGIPARRIGSLKASAKLAEKVASLRSASLDMLQEDCKKLGVPCDPLSREAVVETLCQEALWQVHSKLLG